MERHAHNRELQKHNFSSRKELYASITKEGSLGLLAMGAQGLLMWRQKRKELGEVFPPTTEEEMVRKFTGPANEHTHE